MKKILNSASSICTLFIKNRMQKMVTPKSAFIFAGLASTIWFILRVIPKPTRATYPCMRAAAPIMSSFIIWSLSIFGMGVFYKKAKTSFSKSKYVVSGLFVLAFLATMAMFQGQNAKNIFARPAVPGVNAVVGTAKGIFPGRVAWTYNANAAKWTGSGNFWASGNSQADYNSSFTAGIKSLSGGSDDATSWDLMFKWFNGTHGRTGTGYVAGDKIAIKINQNNTAYSGTGGSGMNANPYACVAIVASLVNAGVPQIDIWIGDPSRAVTDNIFNLIHTAYPDVNVVDYFGNNGRKTTGTTTGDYPQYNKISSCFATARYLVSLPILKGHPGQYFSFGAKNWFGVGAISNNYVNNPHPSSTDFEATYMTHANIGGKVILWCMDASYPCVDISSTPSTNKGANFIMSLDGAAEESVSLDMWNMYYGKGFAGENYIDIAAAGGAGAHEHWDSNTTKRYTRNITPTANGIELVYVVPTTGPTVSITAPATGSTVVNGTAITISGTATPESGKTISKVEVTAGTTPLTVTGTTSWSCSYTPATAGSLTITAKATSSSALTDTKTATVTVTEPLVLPAKVEAENYSAMYGIQTQTTTDTGGGLNVGYTEVGDWMDYLVTVPATGAYTIDFRIASGVTTGKIELRNSAGTALATVSQTVAGDWQGWSTQSVTANLTAGTQTLRIYYTGAGLNINWFDVKTSSINNPPTVTLTAPANNTSVNVNTAVTVSATATDTDGTISKVDFYAGATLIGTDTSSPYSISWTPTTAGTYAITAKATDNGSAVTTSAASSLVVNNVVVYPDIPGTIQAEAYTAMYGIQTQTTTDTGGGLNVGYSEPGDWMDYAVNVTTTGAYSIDFRVASAVTTGQIELRNQAGTTLATLTQGSTGDWQTWVTKTVTANLTAGNQTLRIYYTGAGLNINWIQFSSTIINTPPAVTLTAPANNTSIDVNTAVTCSATATDTDGTVSKVDFYAGATLIGTDTSSPYSISWTPTTAGTYAITAKATDNGSAVTTSAASSLVANSVVVYPSIPGTIQAEAYTAMFGIQTETTTDTGGGLNVGYTEAGDWMDYAVNVETAGTYTVSFRVASQVTTGKIELRNSAGTTLATLTQGSTGNWQTWVTQSVTANLAAGNQTLRIYYTGAGLNINWIQFTATTGSTTVTLNPTADAYVRGGTYAATNYGTTADLFVKSAPETDGLYTRKAYMQFSVAGMTGVESAVVRLYAGTVSPFSVKVNETTDSWTETAINWNNAPVAGTLIATTAITAAGAYYEWNVTSFVQSQAAGDGIVSLVFSDAATTNAQIIFSSKEATSNKPQLVVTSGGLKSANDNSEIQEVLYNELTVYPNPVADELHIKNVDQNSMIEVYNLSGKLVLVKKPGSENYTLNVSNLKSGLYVLKATSANHTTLLKFSKK
jgi:hypothetical protein